MNVSVKILISVKSFFLCRKVIRDCAGLAGTSIQLHTVESPQPSGSCRNVLGQRNHKSALAGMTLIDAGERAALMSVKS